jgi:CDP-diacylglycerol--glycerol-3-phosphate 3-phosphatidyltransferase
LILIFVLRDVLVDGSRNLAAVKQLKIEASIYGKMKTVVQSIGIVILFFVTPVLSTKGILEVSLLNLPLMIAGLLSIISGALYFKQIIPHLNTK